MVTTGGGGIRNKPRSKSFRTNRRNLSKPRVRVTNEHRALVRKEICDFLVKRHGYKYEKGESTDAYLFVYKPGCSSRLRGIPGLLSHLRHNGELVSELQKNSEFFSDVLLDFELRQERALSSRAGAKKRVRQEQTDHRCCRAFASDSAESCYAGSMDETPLECSVGTVCNGFIHPECFEFSEKQIQAATKSTDWVCPLCSSLEEMGSTSSSSTSGGEEVKETTSTKDDHEMRLAALSVLELATPRSRASSMILSPRSTFGAITHQHHHLTDERTPLIQIRSMPQVVALASFAWLSASALNLNKHAISITSLEKGFLSPETEKNGTLDMIMTRLVVSAQSKRRFAEVEEGLNASFEFAWWDERLVKIVNSWTERMTVAKKDLQSRVSRRSTGRPLLRRAVAAALAAGNTTRVAKLFGIPARTLRRHVAKEREILQLPKPSARTRTLSKSVVHAAVAAAELKEEKEMDEDDTKTSEDEKDEKKSKSKKKKSGRTERNMSPELSSYRRSLRALSVKHLRREVKFWETQIAILEGTDSNWWLHQQSEFFDAASILGLWTNDAALGQNDFQDLMSKKITSFADLTVRGRVKIVWALIHYILHESLEVQSAFGRQHSVLSSACRGVSFGHDDEGRSLWHFAHLRDGHFRVYGIASHNPYGWSTLCNDEQSLKHLASRLARALATSPTGPHMLMTSPRVTSNHLRSIGVKALNALVQGLDTAEERARQREASGGTRTTYQCQQGHLLQAAHAMVAQQFNETTSTTDASMFQAVQQVMAMEIAKFMPQTTATTTTTTTTPMVSPVRSITSDEMSPQRPEDPQNSTYNSQGQSSLSVNIPVSRTVVEDEGQETPATTTARFLSKLSFPSSKTTTSEDLLRMIEEDEKSIEREYLQRNGNNTNTRMSRTNICAVCNLEIVDSPVSCSRSRCSKVFHLQCLEPELKERPSGRWHCPTCVASSAKNKKKAAKKTKSTGSGARRRRCGRCAGCLRPQCGQCRNCLDKPCFGGKGTLKQACKLRVCENMKPANLSRRKKQSKNEEEKEVVVKVAAETLNSSSSNIMTETAVSCSSSSVTPAAESV